MSLKRTFFKNAAVFSSYNYASWFFESLVSTVILSRFLTPKEYGFVALINIFSGFITLFANTGISYLIIRTNYGITYQRIIYNLTIWIGLCLGLALSLLAYPITLIYDNPELFWPTIVVSLQFVTNSVNIVPLALLEKKLDFNYVGKLGLFSIIFTVSLMTVMAIMGFTYWSLIVPIVVQPLFRQILIERRAKFGFHIYGWKMTKLGFRLVKNMLASFTIFNFINYFARNADNFLVGKYYGEASLGLYNRAYNFINLGKKVINVSMSRLLLPSLIQAKANGEDIKPYFLDILGMLNVINIFIAVPLIFFAKPIVLLLWGAKWIGVADFIPYIGVIIPLQTLSIAAMDLYIIEKKEKLLVTLEIPLTLIMIAGIIVGAFYSPLHILRFYSLSFLVVLMPLWLYLSLYRVFKFSASQIMKFWVPKTVLSAGMIFSIWFGNPVITGALMLIFITDTIIMQGKDILSIFYLIKNKILPSGNDN